MLGIVAILDRGHEIISTQSAGQSSKAGQPGQAPNRRPNQEEIKDYAEWLLRSDRTTATYAAMKQMKHAVTGRSDDVKWIINVVNDLREQRRYGAAINVLSRGRRDIPASAVN